MNRNLKGKGRENLEDKVKANSESKLEGYLEETTLEDKDFNNFALYNTSSFNASHVCVKEVTVETDGLTLKKHWLQEFNFMENSEASLLMLPGYLVLTNHPGKQRLIKAIEELQFRQDELKEDFSNAIIHLAQNIRY